MPRNSTDILLYTFFCVLASILVHPAAAQVQKQDTAFVQAATAQAVQAYRNSIGRHAHLYTGKEYFDYRKYLREGHQFWETDEFRKGAVQYEGIWYEQVPMLYDIVKDELLIQLENRAFKQMLISQKVTEFGWEGQTFQRFQGDSLTSFRTGFYEVLFQQQVQVLAKRAKIIEDVPEDNLIKMVFTNADRFYILRDQTYHPITTRRSLYAVFKDRKKELQKYYRAQDLNFRKDKEKTIVALAAQYGRLTE
ncbi:hypothetical protein [Pontibacter beigongshangensis]|uniref:hypothetical protein n=1 Tax=Pontibacter beigongshangensis TaxID=2574733 RepID=UPI00164F1300|nr:hypothetical protein [Pontibacter beigongshangensis]